MRRADPERTTTPPDGRPPADQPRWRQDFPIHTPEDEYVSRRDFTRYLALTSLAFVVGQFWILAENLFRSTLKKPPIRPISALGAVPAGGTLVFHYPSPHDPCVLVRVDEKTLVAYSQVCTHLSCAVIPHPQIGRILCPCHDGVFDLATGRPLAGPPQRPLPQIYLSVRNGMIYATGVEARTV